MQYPRSVGRASVLFSSLVQILEFRNKPPPFIQSASLSYLSVQKPTNSNTEEVLIVAVF